MLGSLRNFRLNLSNKNVICSTFMLARQISSSKCMLVSKEFENAKTKLSTLKEEPDNDVKLKIYALFKQATIGQCNTKKPGIVDFVGRAKWSAWNELGSMSQTDAEKSYISLIDELAGAQTIQEASSSSLSQFEHIVTSIENNCIYKIQFNRPNKLNAINVKMYKEIQSAMNEADQNPNIVMCCFTGSGRYYSAGNDLNEFATPETLKNLKKAAEEGRVLFEGFVNSFINFSKPLGAVINGPAVGIAVTTLALFDLVIASDKATFSTPFSKTAQTAEGCSTYTFPMLMGHTKAVEMLMFNKILTAQEAYERNLVTQVIADNELETKAWEYINQVAKFPKESFLQTRRLMRDGMKEKLLSINKIEAEELCKRWSSDEFVKNFAKIWNK